MVGVENSPSDIFTISQDNEKTKFYNVTSMKYECAVYTSAFLYSEAVYSSLQTLRSSPFDQTDFIITTTRNFIYQKCQVGSFSSQPFDYLANSFSLPCGLCKRYP